MNTGAAEGQELSGGQRSSNVYTPLFMFYLLAWQERSGAQNENEQDVFLWVYYCWHYLNFPYEFLFSYSVDTVRLKDIENLISGTKLLYLN